MRRDKFAITIAIALFHFQAKEIFGCYFVEGYYENTINFSNAD